MKGLTRMAEGRTSSARAVITNGRLISALRVTTSLPARPTPSRGKNYSPPILVTAASRHKRQARCTSGP